MAEKTRPSQDSTLSGKAAPIKPDASGFKIPNPDNPQTAPAPSGQATPPPAPSAITGQTNAPSPGGGEAIDTVPRDLAIGGGVLAVLFIVFLFVKNTYANRLISRRVSPGAANASAGWLLVLLTTLSAMLILATVSWATFFTPIYMGPLAAVAALALFFTLRTRRR